MHRYLSSAIGFILAYHIEAAGPLSPEKLAADQWVHENERQLHDINQRIWSLAELGLEEHQSSETL